MNLKSVFVVCLFGALLLGVSANAFQTGEVELLTTPWTGMVANNGAVERYQSIDPWALAGKDSVRVAINCYGATLNGGDASALIFDQDGWKYVSLSNYLPQGCNGVTVITIPLSAFGLDLSQPVGTLHTRFWSEPQITVDITSIVVFSSQPEATATEIFTATVAPSETSTLTPTVIIPTATATLTPSVTPVSSTATSQPTQVVVWNSGLVHNGSFEIVVNDFAEGWTRNGAVAINGGSQGYHGSYSLHFTPNGQYANANSWGFGIVPGQSYQVSAYVRSTAGTGNFGIKIDESNSSWQGISSQILGEVSGNYNSVVSFTYTPTSANVANVALQFYRNADVTFEVFVDAVSFAVASSQTPDPATAVPTSTDVAPSPTATATNTHVPAGLPSPWQSVDIGGVSLAGDASFAGSTFTLKGSGTDIWESNDQFRYLYRPLSGDGTITARILSHASVDSWGKAGLMIKESVGVGSPYAMVSTTGSNGSVFQWNFTNSSGVSGLSLPHWMKLERAGNTLTGFVSSDGSSWQQVGTAQVSMPEMVTVGLFITSHNNSQIAFAEFDNVVVSNLSVSATSTPEPEENFVLLESVVLVTPELSTPAATAYPACPAGLGPDSITAGDYPPTKLTQDQRQWLYNVFGHSGTAPVGYGGERCGNSYDSSWDNFKAMICRRGQVGPGGIIPGSYNPQNLTQDQRNWLYHQFGNAGTASVGYGGEHCPNQTSNYTVEYIHILSVCSSGAKGPYGMNPGSYPPEDLYPDERNWLYNIFGNSGTAPVGYGGQMCPNQSGNLPAPNRTGAYNPAPRACPFGVGEPGTFPPTTLTQLQRNQLYWAFGHSGEAPVGYGGEHCYGGTMTLSSFVLSNNPGVPDSYNPTGSGGGSTSLPVFSGLTSLDGQPPGQYIRVTVNGLRVRANPSTASVIRGYLTNGHYYKLLHVRNGWGQIQDFGWSFLSDFTEISFHEQGQTGSVNSQITVIEFYYPNLHHSYTLLVSKTFQSCYITNGAEIISEEVVRFNNWISTFTTVFYPFALYDYMAQNHSQIESFRNSVETLVFLYMGECSEIKYLVGSKKMDTSGLGNIMFGYASSTWPEYVSSPIQNWAQRLNEVTITSIVNQCGGVNLCSLKLWLQVTDEEDDEIQVNMGNRLAELTVYKQAVMLNFIPLDIIIKAANDVGLR